MNQLKKLLLPTLLIGGLLLAACTPDTSGSEVVETPDNPIDPTVEPVEIPTDTPAPTETPEQALP